MLNLAQFHEEASEAGGIKHQLTMALDNKGGGQLHIRIAVPPEK